MRKWIAFVLAAAMLCSMLAGCGTVGDIAQNVANAAMEELKNQVAATLEKKGVRATVRRKLGADINASCGQLRRAEQNGQNA